MSQTLIAQMVELVDTLVSGTSGRKAVGVRVPLWVQLWLTVLIISGYSQNSTRNRTQHEFNYQS